MATLAHHEARLPLGGDDRLLAVLTCDNEGDCPTWLPDGGANHCAVLAPGTRRAWDEPRPDADRGYPDCRVVRWSEGDDGIPESEYALHFGQGVGVDRHPPESQLVDVPKTRLGGTPEWLQDPAVGTGRWTFVAQIDGFWEAAGPPPTLDEISPYRIDYDDIDEDPDPDRQGSLCFGAAVEGDGRWYVWGPNFGMGLGYVFLDHATDPPSAMLVTQR